MDEEQQRSDLEEEKAELKYKVKKLEENLADCTSQSSADYNVLQKQLAEATYDLVTKEERIKELVNLDVSLSRFIFYLVISIYPSILPFCLNMAAKLSEWSRRH